MAMHRSGPAAALCFLVVSLASAQTDVGAVRDEAVEVHREASAGSDVVATLAVGEKVRIDWSVAAEQGEWCSVSRLEDPRPLGFVPCQRLDRKTIGAEKRAPAEPARPLTLTRAQMSWGLAASALLTEHNRGRHDTLSGIAATAQSASDQRGILARWWDVTDRDSLLGVLASLDARGHRQEFADLGEKVVQLSTEDFEALLSNPDLSRDGAQRVSAARKYFRQLGARSLVGWDYARYVSLCRWGYTAGYLNEGEAWQGIMHAAGILRRTFGSWRELGENYLIGREFWSPEETRRVGDDYRAAFEQLLSDPASPWNRIPWSLEIPEAAAPAATR
jgi:Protein of unknown function (DUF1266)